jgi:hypothetical protein
MHRISTKFLSMILTADQKHQRVNVCEELHQTASDNAAFFTRVITGDESWIYCYDPETKQQSSQWKGPNSPRSFSLTSRGLFTKNLSWLAKPSIPNTTVMFYGDCMKMCEDFAPNLGDKRTGCCITTTHHLTLPFSPGNF